MTQAPPPEDGPPSTPTPSFAPPGYPPAPPYPSPGYPPPGYPPSYGPPGYPGWPGYPGHAVERSLLMRTVLDQQVAESKRDRPPWPARATWGAPALLVGLIVVLNVVALLVLPHTHGGGTITALAIETAAELLLLGGVLALARPLAAAEGGWRRAFGVSWVRGSDWLPWITGVGMAFVARIVIAIVAAVATHGAAARESSNVQLNHVTVVSLVGLALVAVVLAPVTEELIFRGIMLRGLMRRMPFWPAALISSVIFGGLHAYEVGSVAGAITLAASVGTLGLVNCYLVRITGRLTPGVMVHATFNLLAVVVVALLR